MAKLAKPMPKMPAGKAKTFNKPSLTPEMAVTIRKKAAKMGGK